MLFSDYVAVSDKSAFSGAKGVIKYSDFWSTLELVRLRAGRYGVNQSLRTNEATHIIVIF